MSDNINLEITLDDKVKKVLEKYTVATEKLTKIMEKPNKQDSDKELKAAEIRDKTEKDRTANVDAENQNYEAYRRITTQRIHENRKEAMNIKHKQMLLQQEKRMNDKMRLEEVRHFNEMMQRMVSGSWAGKAIGAGMGAGKLGGMAGGHLMKGAKKLAKKSAILRAFMLEEGSMTKAENQEAAGGISIGFGDQKAKEVTKKTQGFLRTNPIGQSIVKAMEKSKVFSDKMQGGMKKYGGAIGGGLGIAGVAGGALITKAIESSPIAQSMMKIMNTAFTLILRPIGDFFGGIFKPISIRLLKWGAENVQKMGADAMKFGEKIGTHLVAFFTSPLEYLGHLADYAGNVILMGLAEMINGILPMGWGKIDVTGFETHLATIEEEMMALAGDVGLMDGFVSEASQGLSNVETTQKDIETILTEMNESTKTIATAAEEQEKLNQEAENKASGIYGGYGSKEEQQSELERLMEETKSKHPEAWANAMAGTGDARGGKGMGAEKAEQWIGATDKVREILETINTGLEPASLEILANFEAMKEAGILGNEKQTELREQFAKAVEDGTGLYADLDKRNVAHQKIMETEKLIQGEKEKEISDIIAKTSEEFQVAYNKVKKMISSMKRSSNGSSGSGGGNNKAVGGMITEPVIGVGLHTGDAWSFGERGLEYVTPHNGQSGNSFNQNSNVVINVNIDRVASNVDLQQIKPIVERALRESHSRRGII